MRPSGKTSPTSLRCWNADRGRRPIAIEKRRPRAAFSSRQRKAALSRPASTSAHSITLAHLRRARRWPAPDCAGSRGAKVTCTVCMPRQLLAPPLATSPCRDGNAAEETWLSCASSRHGHAHGRYATASLCAAMLPISPLPEDQADALVGVVDRIGHHEPSAMLPLPAAVSAVAPLAVAWLAPGGGIDQRRYWSTGDPCSAEFPADSPAWPAPRPCASGTCRNRRAARCSMPPQAGARGGTFSSCNRIP